MSDAERSETAQSGTREARTQERPESTLARMYRLTGLMLPWTLVTFVIAWLVHGASGMPQSYSWLQPWRILRDVVERPYLPAVMVSAYLVGRYRRRGEWQVGAFIARLRDPLTWSNFSWKPIAALLLGMTFLAVDSLLFSAHAWIDHLALMMLAGLLVFRQATSASPKLFFGNVAMVSLVFTLCSYAFTVFKALLFQIEPLKEEIGELPPAGWLAHEPWTVELIRRLPVMDETILAIEEAVFGTPWHRVIARWAAEHPTALYWLDEVYFYFFDHMFIVSLLLIGLRLAATRTEYFSALAICYLLGGLAYFAMPGVGPLYWEPHLYTHLAEQKLNAGGVGFWLLMNTGAMVEGAAQDVRTFGYIACMPSLHMAQETVMLWYARKSRLALVLSIVFTGLTFVAIQALGFHYAIDALGGFLLAVFAIFIASRQRERLFPAFLHAADEPLPERRSVLRELRDALSGGKPDRSRDRQEDGAAPDVDPPLA